MRMKSDVFVFTVQIAYYSTSTGTRKMKVLAFLYVNFKIDNSQRATVYQQRNKVQI